MHWGVENKMKFFYKNKYIYIEMCLMRVIYFFYIKKIKFVIIKCTEVSKIKCDFREIVIKNLKKFFTIFFCTETSKIKCDFWKNKYITGVVVC